MNTKNESIYDNYDLKQIQKEENKVVMKDMNRKKKNS